MTLRHVVRLLRVLVACAMLVTLRAPVTASAAVDVAAWVDARVQDEAHDEAAHEEPPTERAAIAHARASQKPRSERAFVVHRRIFLTNRALLC